jgi:hypothetical protein
MPEKASVPPSAPAPVTPVEAPPTSNWGWRLTIFLWLASFTFLYLYEVLAAVARVVARWMGHR